MQAQLNQSTPEPGKPGRPVTGPGRTEEDMGFLDTILGRTKPVQPKLDDLFGLPSAAVQLQAGGLHPHRVRLGGLQGRRGQDVRRRPARGAGASRHGQRQAGGGLPVEVTRDSYGYTWLVSTHMSDEMDALVTDLHAVNTALVDSGYGPQLLCTLVAFRDESTAASRSSTCTSAARSTRSPRCPAARTTRLNWGQGRARRRPQDRAGHVPLVPHLGRARFVNPGWPCVSRGRNVRTVHTVDAYDGAVAAGQIRH